ncbi:MAG: prolipoprotein diacylglyceryl transferase [Eubacteriales bacterium]
MYNDLFSIGPLTIHSYGLMIGIGVVVALLVGEHRAKKRDLDGDFIYGLVAATVILGFLGARILFIITEWSSFLENPARYLTGSGFVVYGGIIAGALTMYGYCKLKKVNLLDYIDLLVPSVAFAQGFGRIGCFLAGCCYGRETDSCIGVVFTHSSYAPNNVKLLPTQLFMSAGDFLIAILLLIYAKKKRVRGQVGAVYLMMYSVGRFFIEFLRNDERGNVGFLSTSQFIAIFIFLGSALAYWKIIPFLENKRTLAEENKEKVEDEVNAEGKEEIVDNKEVEDKEVEDKEVEDKEVEDKEKGIDHE